LRQTYGVKKSHARWWWCCAAAAVVVVVTTAYYYYYCYYYCDFTHIYAARESKRLPQEHQKPHFLISQNFSQREVGSIRLPKVQIGSNGLPKVRVQSQRFCSEDNPRRRQFTVVRGIDLRQF
jgi:hypothetical protein